MKKISFLFQLHLWNSSEVATERIWNGRKIPWFSSPYITAWGGCSSSRSCDTKRGFTRGATRKHLVLVLYYNSIFDFIGEIFEFHGYNSDQKIKAVIFRERSLVLLNSIAALFLYFYRSAVKSSCTELWNYVGHLLKIYQNMY